MRNSCFLALVWSLLVACAKTYAVDAGMVPQTEFVERYMNGADTNSPLIIAIHGLGDRPESFITVFDGFTGRAEIAAPHGFSHVGLAGWSWFDPNISHEALNEALGESEAALWPAILKRAHGRKVIITGFSQGGMLSYAIAARHPDEVTYAFPIAGGLPDGLRPVGKAAAPVWAEHGTADKRIDINWARETVRTFDHAELHEYPDVGHTITDAMRDDLFTQLLKVAPAP